MNLVLTTELGTVTVPEAVLVGIVVRAAEGVEGIKVRRRRTVDTEARVVRLSVSARRGEPLVDLATRAQGAVADALEATCGIETKVDVVVGELT
jgi:uncharacterized alkaline shock family protein YloU